MERTNVVCAMKLVALRAYVARQPRRISCGLARTGVLEPIGLRSLDAIHLAAVQLIAPVVAVVTYDRRLADAATSLGFAVAAPA